MKAGGNCQCSGVLCFWSLFFFRASFWKYVIEGNILNIKNFLSGSLWQRDFFQYPFVTVARSSPQSKFSVNAEWDQIYWSFTLHWVLADAATGSALQTMSPLPSLPPGSFAFCDRKVFFLCHLGGELSYLVNLHRCALLEVCDFRNFAFTSWWTDEPVLSSPRFFRWTWCTGDKCKTVWSKLMHLECKQIK